MSSEGRGASWPETGDAAPDYRPNAAFQRVLRDKAKLDSKLWGGQG